MIINLYVCSSMKPPGNYVLLACINIFKALKSYSSDSKVCSYDVRFGVIKYRKAGQSEQVNS
jgi:hypothetical protein